MRIATLVLSAALVAGCHDDDNRLATLESNTSDLTALRAELAQLRKQVGDVAAQQQPAPDVKPILQRLDALEAQVAKLQPQKQVYLVAKAGTIDEKVIGLVTGTGCAWSNDFGGELCFNSTFDVYYANPDCTGEAFIEPSRYVANRLVRGNEGSLYMAMSGTNEFPVGALQRPGGACVERPAKLVAHPLKSMGSLPLYDPSDFSVALR